MTTPKFDYDREAEKIVDWLNKTYAMQSLTDNRQLSPIGEDGITFVYIKLKEVYERGRKEAFKTCMIENQCSPCGQEIEDAKEEKEV